MDFSTMWEDVPRDAPQIRARQHLLSLAAEIQGQTILRMEAARKKKEELRKLDRR
jgi:hypothetical protein